MPNKSSGAELSFIRARALVAPNSSFKADGFAAANSNVRQPMTYSGGLARFTRFMVDWAASVVDPVIKKERSRDDISELERNLFDDVFRRFSEINETLENLDLCLTFIKSPMPRRKGIKPDRALAYHLTFYIQEIYILSERLEAYAKIIYRIKKRRTKSDNGDSRYSVQIDALRESLGNIIKIRGAHVHHRSFVDKDLDRLSTLSLISTFEPDFVDDLRFEYRYVRDIWVRRLEQNGATLKVQIDEFFDFIYRELTEGSSPVLPNSSFKPKPLRGSA
jgi:hypothetical protein